MHKVGYINNIDISVLIQIINPRLRSFIFKQFLM